MKIDVSHYAKLVDARQLRKHANDHIAREEFIPGLVAKVLPGVVAVAFVFWLSSTEERPLSWNVC